MSQTRKNVKQLFGSFIRCHDVMGLFWVQKNWFWAESWAKEFKTNRCFLLRVALHIGMSWNVPQVNRNVFRSVTIIDMCR